MSVSDKEDNTGDRPDSSGSESPSADSELKPKHDEAQSDEILSNASMDAFRGPDHGESSASLLDGQTDILRASKHWVLVSAKQQQQDGVDADADTTRRLSLEELPEDVSSHVLLHLQMNEVSYLSQVSKRLYRACRSNILWKKLFHRRWNVDTTVIDDSQSGSYFSSFVQAYLHPHDLWITHSNCVSPWDGIAPGRCCIQPMQPNDDTDLDSTRSTKHATEAFKCAATFHRKLSLLQYVPSPTHFLSDVLFFNMTDPSTSEGQLELRSILHEYHETQLVDSLMSTASHLEASNHSWHVIKIMNADFYRPIVFQFGVCRSECFSVFPSEGLIEPGQSSFVTIGVRPLGAAMAYAYGALNVQRDALDSEWADLYTDEAHLPFVPFLLRYRFINRQPGSADPMYNPRQRPPESQQRARSRNIDVHLKKITQRRDDMEHYWKQTNVPSHEFRSIKLSAHVNSHYAFHDFQRFACTGWSSSIQTKAETDPLLMAPTLRELHGDTFRLVQSAIFSAAVDNSGVQLADVLQEERQRQTVGHNILQVLRTIEQGKVPLEGEKVATLLLAIFEIVHATKAAPWTSPRQRECLCYLEQYVDSIWTQIPVGGEGWEPWRMSGTYRSRTCSGSIFGHCKDELYFTAGKNEPEYLETFRHLAHSPGRFCLGRQDDPNHSDAWRITTNESSNRYSKKVLEHYQDDMFMNDPISVFQAGVCMITDPRSLLVHGVFDRIKYPGSVCRRPAITKRNDSKIPSPYNDAVEYSLLRYLHQAPPPGVGRYALTKFAFHDSAERFSVLELKTEERKDPETAARESYLGTREPIRVPSQQQEIVVVHNPGGNLRGPRLFQLLWTLGAQIGLAVIDDCESPTIFVERSILIASQWISISLGIAPLIWTMVARFLLWVPTSPADQRLPSLLHASDENLRFLSERECGYVALVLIGVWFALARWAERNTAPDFIRTMSEALGPAGRGRNSELFLMKFARTLRLWSTRQWDAFCPLFLQHRVFSPTWNRRTHADLMRHIALWRSKDLDKQRTAAEAKVSIGRNVGRPLSKFFDAGTISAAWKVLIGVAVVLGSFCSSTPHFWLNAIGVFSCSISLGMAVSIHALEKGRLSPSIRNSSTRSLFFETNLVTIAILGILVGQLLGASGGTMFLAEFVVTSISLVLGGAGTISASAMESWVCFFGLFCVAFVGYLFGRTGTVDGMRLKRSGFSSQLLSKAVAFVMFFWAFIFVLVKFDSYINVVISRFSPEEHMAPSNHNLGRLQ